MAFTTPPSAPSLKLTPFTANVSDQDYDDFRKLVSLSKIGPKTFENQVANVKDYNDWGITRDWLVEAKQRWESGYDWRKTEGRINSFPNYTAPITEDGFEYQIHFIALFSKKTDAIPLTLLHGWPGSILEFLDVLDILRKKYDEDTLPYHVIVPSLPGYAYSSGPPLDKNFTTEGIANVIDKLMVGLGFGKGYITQGGDIGSFVSRVLGVTKQSCKAVHLNLAIGIQEPKNAPVSSLSSDDQKGVQRCQEFATLGSSYASEHGTRPATVGLVLAASPIALLAWIGEKFLQWSDTNPSIDAVLDSITLYWFTESFARCIYPYRQFFGPKPTFFHPDAEWHIKKPLGYTWHAHELAPVPKDWVATSGNLVWFRNHTDGGHFAAMEKPQQFVDDIEDFIAQVWPTVKDQ